MRKTIIECVALHARRIPHQVAVVCGDTETTYAELFDLVCGYRGYLLEKGVKKGDIVVFRASQSLGFVIQYLSVHSIGAVVASLEKKISADSMLDIARQLGADVVMGEPLPELARECLYIPLDDVVSVARQHPRSEIEQYPDLDASADILFTTGTTGASKGVELSHNALAATAENLIYGCGYRPDTVLLAPGPLNHANAIRKLFTTLVNGSTIVILDGMLNLKAFYRALDRGQGSIAACLPPAAIRTIFQLTKDRIGNYCQVIDFIESASAPLPEVDKARLCRLLPNTRLYNNYGSSEAASVCMYDYNKNAGKENCIGKAMPNSQVIIVDENKREIQSSPANMGFLACKGDVNMKGYHNEPELTREVLVDGIVYTNDVGYIDEEGYIYIVGRKGDVINVGGLKVAPTEVEAAALAYEGVEDCICIAVDDNVTGKALKLLVVMRENCDLKPSEIQRFFAARLESHKIPRFYEAVDQIRRTYNGKLDRKVYL